VSHRPVLLGAALDALRVKPNGSYLDATFGRGGHARAIFAALGEGGRLIAIDRDPQAIAFGAHLPQAWDLPDCGAGFDLLHARFGALSDALDRCGVDQLDGVLFDLGVSSPQLDQAERGFSFKLDGPLDMRMNPAEGLSARQWLREATSEAIEAVLRDFGEERQAKAIARAIKLRFESEGESALQTTAELAALIQQVLRRRGVRRDDGKDLATRSFQAIRMKVNQELEEIDAGLEQALDRLAPKACLAVISFHSIEDRKVKQFFARQSGASAERDPITGAVRREAWPILSVHRHLPDAQEVKDNPRARSAVLRFAYKNAYHNAQNPHHKAQNTDHNAQPEGAINRHAIGGED
jgi:16S rRNA (cytosine1402-N4)-methyltransferase